MSVGQNNCAQLVLILYNICEIRYYCVNAGHVIFRKRYAAVYENHIIISFKNSQVFAPISQIPPNGIILSLFLFFDNCAI